MWTNIPSILSRLALSAALVCFSSGVSPAQEQLSDTTVNQQVPLAFSQEGEESGVAGGYPVVPDDAAAVQVPAADAAVAGAGDSPATALSGDVDIPSGNVIPAQPEQPRLVPATAMGTAAQKAAEGNDAPVDIEALAAEMQEPVQSSGLPDVLEKYTAATPETLNNSSADGYGDALPEVSNLNMVRLQGDFDNSNKRVSVAVGDGSEINKRLEEEIRSEAFDAAITGMFPLSPEQIQSLLKKYDSTQKIVNTPPYDAPKPEISVQNISLDPGIAPPVIRTAVGNVTTINVLDATGAPWPVQDVTWAGDFEIVEPEEGGHIIRITPMAQFARGNIVVRLLTLKTPLTMTLETSREVVQYRIDARIPEYGPFANAPLMQGAKSTLVAGSPDLTSLLDGVMPGGMQRLTVSGVDGRTTAYTMNGTTYLRTPLTLLSPAWQSSVSSADGMNVYALSNAPVLLLSDGGEFQRAVLKEKEGLLDE